LQSALFVLEQQLNFFFYFTQFLITVFDQSNSLFKCGQRIFELMLKTASGRPTKSESFDFGGAEFAPWVLGATM